MASVLIEAPPSGTSTTNDGVAPRHARKGHIGLIVVGTILATAIAALLLDIVVFVGAAEDTITGVTLLAFGMGWCAMTVASTRYTDQPQRWALTPAVVMALLGVGHLVLRPTNGALEAFGWVWPLPLLGLTIWMARQARANLHTRARVWIVYPVLAVLGAAAVGGVIERVAETRDRSALSMPGRLVSVGTHRLHINCTGAGATTVVLEAGLGETSVIMAGRIAPAVARHARVCVYDRAGRGWSEPTSSAVDGIQTATDLHALLQRAGEKPPFVLAGHSAGGAYVLNFANLYPNQTAGVVLLDSMHPEQYARVASWPTFWQGFRRASGLLPSLSRLGAGRVVAGSSYGDLPPRARREERAFVSTARAASSVRDEFGGLRSALTQAHALTTLGDKPLIVVSAAKGAEPEHATLQAELAGLSTNAAHRTVDVTHEALVESKDGAATSARAIADVVDAIETGRHL
jgi:pimeloyl-ACP methyl ester carboxylesterase